MTDAFEKWIMGMDDGMYEDWLDDTATDAQTDVALEIREPLSDIELAEIEREQEYIPESRQKEVVTDVYDNRDLPQKKIYAEVILPPTGRAPIIKPITNTTGQPIITQPISQPALPRQPIQPQPRKSFSQRVFGRVSGFFSRFRRKK